MLVYILSCSNLKQSKFFVFLFLGNLDSFKYLDPFSSNTSSSLLSKSKSNILVILNYVNVNENLFLRVLLTL